MNKAHWILFVAISAAIVHPAAQAQQGVDAGNRLVLERLGAGIPAGWLIEGSNYEWKALSEPGPAGLGAAEIIFSEKGRFELSSPSLALPEGKNCLAGIWLRSNPAGATVRIEMFDNDEDGKRIFEQTFTATDQWAFAKVEGIAAHTLKNRYYLRLSGNGENCSLDVDGLWLGEMDEPFTNGWRPNLRPAGVVLLPETPWGVVGGNEPMRVKARVVGATQSGTKLALHLVQTSGVAADLDPIAIDASGLWNGTIDISHDLARLYGMLRVEATVVDAEGKPLSSMAETLLARAPEPIPGPKPESPFGVHVLLKDSDLATMAKLGYKWIRIHDASGITKWGYAEPEKGKWEWHDEEVDNARKHGLCILGMLDGAPAWETGTTEEGYFRICHAPKNMDNWRNYVRQMVGHYAGRIDQWEVWNEPWDMGRFFQEGTPDLYVELMKSAYEEAKATNPNALIVGLDTYPPIWEIVVLAMGGYPHYDMASWHRYDPNLAGRPNDSIARVTARINGEQAKYGPPKPTLCSEGGPDVGMFHGSFFSFADPTLLGDWSEGADRYSRMVLSAIAAGNKRFIMYSVHGITRHGRATHNMVEPGPLMRPAHMAVSGLAHFIEGAKLDKRLTPAPDISALVFAQPNPRPYAKGPSTVLVLYSDGKEPQDLPKPVPSGVKAYDRWGNEAPIPTQATRSLTYLVAEADAGEALLAAFDGSTSAPYGTDVPALVAETVAVLCSQDRPFWPLFSTQGSLAVVSTAESLTAVTRTELKVSPEKRKQFDLLKGTQLGGVNTFPAGQFVVGNAELTGPDGTPAGRITFSVSKDGPGGTWRYLSFTLQPKAIAADETTSQALINTVKPFEMCLVESTTKNLHGLYHDGPCLVMTCTPNGEYFVFEDPEQLISMMNTAVMWGKAQKSILTFSSVLVDGPVATLYGKWDIASLSLGMADFGITATLVKSGDGWKIASMCAGAGDPPPGE